MPAYKSLVFVAIALIAVFGAAPGGALAGDWEIGRAIYEEGRLPSGRPLLGKRFGSESVSGEAAACITCHRRSGMGAVEGEVLVSPITSKALFSETERVIATMDPRRGKSFNRPHPPYSAATLASALREGVQVSGREMHPLMPRYAFTEAELRGVMAYLQKLSGEWSPGVSAEQIDFATVITPGVAPEKKRALLEMLSAMVRIKNSSTRPGRRYMTNPAEMMLKSGRRWQVSVWELKGPPETWGEQLSGFYREKPVFAILSGLSGTTWAPVDAFCQKERIPCLFPSLDVPPVTDGPDYATYFSRGVMLEADVLGSYLKNGGARAGQRVVQVQDGSFASQVAAHRFEQAMRERALVVETRRLERDAATGLPQLLDGLGADTSVVLWLGAEAVKGLDGLPAPSLAQVFFSGFLLDGKPGRVPATWRGLSKMVYPYELPEKRRANVAYLNAWLKLTGIEMVNEPLQSEIFFALNFVTDTVSEMLNNLYRDYLLERTVNMLAFREGSKAEQELRDRAVLGRSTLRGTNPEGASRPEAAELLALGKAEQGIGEQAGTTVYPRLSLGAGQNFASKGAYIVKYEGPNSDSVISVTEWLVP